MLYFFRRKTVLQNGAAAAAEDLNLDISFVYSDWNAEKMLKNFREGLASKPDGMVVIGMIEAGLVSAGLSGFLAACAGLISALCLSS